MRSIPERAKRNGADGPNGVFHCTFAGADKPEWTLRFSDGGCDVAEGLVGSPDCSIQTDEATIVGIQDGTVNPQMAFMAGKIKVSNLMMMMSFGKLLWDGE
jgi:putative sterol carrier protein